MEDVNERCREAFEGIEDLKGHLKQELAVIKVNHKNQAKTNKKITDNQALFEIIKNNLTYTMYIDITKEQHQKWQQIRKMFARKSWEDGKAKQQTEILLIDIKDAIYKSDEYQACKANMILPEVSHKAMKEISKKIDNCLIKNQKTNTQ